MAIRIECYTLIIPVDIGKRYFPEDYPNEWCWNDGAICRIMGAMNPLDVRSMVETCLKLGLIRYKGYGGKIRIGDFYVASQFGWDDTNMQDKESGWLRVYQGVAWNPSYPLGLDLPNKFPCYHGGFYYKSEEVWRQSRLALSAFNKVLDEHRNECLKKTDCLEDSESLFSGLPRPTPYDDFFIDLERETFKHQLEEHTARSSSGSIMNESLRKLLSSL